MGDAGQHQALAAECVILCTYLTGRRPPEYVQTQYVRAHEGPELKVGPTESIRDTLLVRMARTGPRSAAFADAYTAVFAKRAVLRKKLILLLAILETSAPTFDWVDSVTTPSRWAFLVRTAVMATAFVFRAVIVAVVLLPLTLGHALWTRFRSVRASGGS